MAIVRVLLTVVGILCALMGLLWVGQGTGIVRWPADSFMIGVSAWTIRGAALFVVGVGLYVYSRRVGRA
jgi:uncharacterized membrane protein